MKNMIWTVAAVLTVLVGADAVMAADGLSNVGKGVGAGIAILGAGIGLGLIGAGMSQSMARQPEMANDLRNASIIIAALLEGVALFALLICFLIA